MRLRYAVATSIAAAIVIIDLVTKRYAAVTFDGNPVSVIGDFFSFTYHENPGAAFSLFPEGGQFLGVAALVIIGLLLYTLRLERPMLEVIAYGFVLGGAAGNLADRIFRADGFLDGPVIDWINLWFIPTFNIADTAITVAVVLLIIDAWRRR